MNQPFRVSPSLISRYFFHDCERFLRFSATPAKRKVAEGVPSHQPDTSPVMEAIRDAGYGWEEQVVSHHLKGKVILAPGDPKAPVHERRFDIQGTLDALRTATNGRYIYQASLRTPERFYQRFGIDPDLIRFSDNHPDLIAVSEADGHRRFQIIDIKRSDTAKAIHRIQILLYAWELEDILRTEKIDGSVDLVTGGVWLGGHPVPVDLDLDAVRPHVVRFLSEDLPRICSGSVSDANWHLYFRCEWCDYFSHCREGMVNANDVSRLPGLTAFGKRFLARHAVHSVNELADFLKRDDADQTLSRCASLTGRGHLLRGQTEAFVTGSAIVHGAGSMALPRGENIAVFLTAQEEPLEQSCYLAGVLVQMRDEFRPAIIGDSAEPKPEVWVAKARTSIPKVAARVIEYLDTVFTNVANYNANREWKDQLTLQCYVHNERERAVFSRLLLTALDDPSTQQAAMRLLLHFSSPDLANADKHPSEPIPYPLVVLLSAQAQLLALPVDASYTLPESLAALGSSFSYSRNAHVHFPLGHSLRPDGIHKVWDGHLDPEVVRNNAKTWLYAVRALLFELRKHAHGQLAAWPPKFTAPGTNGIRTPLLAKLAFFTRFESVMTCLEIRAMRAEAREVQRQSESIIELAAVDSDTFEVLHGPSDLDADSFPSWLLVTDDDAGRLAQMQFPDYVARKKRFHGKASDSRALVGIEQVDLNRAGKPISLRVSWAQKFSSGTAKQGRRYVLSQRYLDWNVDRVIDWLAAIPLPDARALASFLTAPTSGPQPLPSRIEKAAEKSEPLLSLTPSQSAAYRALRGYENTVVWGPPGTGKTHFIGSVVAALLAAHHAHGARFRVLVTAFTHAAIENVLKSISKVMAVHFPKVNGRVLKAGEWKGQAKPDLIEEVGAQFGAEMQEYEQVVIGATAYACIKAEPEELFDLVILDEASQVRLSEACVSLTLVRADGRLLLAGDHQQLPPIIKGEWPDPVDGPPIHQSILQTLRVDRDPALGLQLHENWRMNATLTAIASEFIYGSQYQCASREVAEQRLRWRVPGNASKFARFCLDPGFSLVLVVLEGTDGGKESPFEALLVAKLSRALRDGLRQSNGKPYASDEAFFHGAGKTGPGLFVVSPHHVQIAEIKREIAKKALSRPFVDTVEKMQGQEAEAVFISYGVSDPEFAMQEAEFIYGRNRLNVAITRARSKVVLFLPRPLLEAAPGVLDVEPALEGLAFMRQIHEKVRTMGEARTFKWRSGQMAEVFRFDIGRS